MSSFIPLNFTIYGKHSTIKNRTPNHFQGEVPLIPHHNFEIFNTHKFKINLPDAFLISTEQAKSISLDGSLPDDFQKSSWNDLVALKNAPVREDIPTPEELGLRYYEL